MQPFLIFEEYEDAKIGGAAQVTEAEKKLQATKLECKMTFFLCFGGIKYLCAQLVVCGHQKFIEEGN